MNKNNKHNKYIKYGKMRILFWNTRINVFNKEHNTPYLRVTAEYGAFYVIGTVSVFAIRNFKFLGFALGRNGKGIYVRVHPKSWKKFKSRLKELSSRRSCQSIKPSLEKIKVYARGWLNYYGIASMKNNIDDINGWLYHRIRMCIWKQWKKPRTKYKNLVKLGIPEDYAATIANSRRKYWYISNNKAVIWALNKERLINSGFYDLATAYQSVHVNY